MTVQPLALDPDPTEERDLEALKRKVHSERGFNTAFYKQRCLRRRFAVRMRARGLSSFADYAALLDRDPSEYDALLDALTINVTKFFRNPEMWSALEREVVPALVAMGARPTRVWSAGCASGEEAYSVSIVLREWTERHGAEPALRNFDIVGTDIDRGSLAAARVGVYPELSMGDTPLELLGRWFSPGPPYRLCDCARPPVSFEHRDLLSGEPLRDQHLILCRNVIIYFDRSVQEELFRTFYDALAPGGFLVLGKVETLLGPTRTLFRPVSARERIFRKPE